MAYDPAGMHPQLRTLLTAEGRIELSLADVANPVPGAGEVVVAIEGAPINPSDLGLLLGAADVSQAVVGGTAALPTLSAPMPPAFMRGLAGRVGQSLPVGNEGAGRVVAAGAGAEGLMGRMVALFGGATYARYRLAAASDVLLLPADATAAEGASCFVNPLTALGMVETMRREGHTALVHTAAASNLGQMLQKICIADGVPLVNIVRSAEQAAILRGIGATYVVDSSAADFPAALGEAIGATGATLAFDAIGGGRLAGQILAAMEAAIVRRGGAYSRYGSNVHKQVYIYGGLDIGPTEFNRAFGMSWGIGGWLLMPRLQQFGAEAAARLRARVVAELRTTFASHYAGELSLAEVLSPGAIAQYNRRATGLKFLVNPAKGG